MRVIGIRASFRAVGLLILSIFAAACAQQQIGLQADQFNSASANTNIKHILLNAARASKSRPLQFTQVAKYTGNNMLSGSFAPNLPFGPDATSIFDLKPTLNLSSGVATIEFGDLNTAEAMNRLGEPIDYSNIDTYLSTTTSVPWDLFATLAIARFEIAAPLYDALIRTFRARCSDRATHPLCKNASYITDRCPHWTELTPGYFPSGRYTVSYNVASDECTYLAFQGFLIALKVNNFSIDIVDTDSWIKVKDLDGKIKTEKRTERAPQIYFGNSPAQDVYARLQKVLKSAKETPFKAFFRSPKGMIEYLGDIIRLENFSNDPYVPEVFVNGVDRVPLAIIEVGHGGKLDSAVDVRDEEGDVFYVPKPDYGSPHAHLTLRVMSIISDFVAGRITKQSLPATSGVVFVTQ